MILHLGVIDVPYSHDTKGELEKKLQSASARAKVVKDKPPAKDLGVTTGDVAEFLEAEYHVMELFAEEAGRDAITEAIGRSISNGIEDVFAGGPPDIDITQDAMAEIEETFRIFIDQRELDGVMPGVPTMAALKGVNHRLLHPYAKGNPERPSFKDTGLYQASMKAWTD
jgi:hypothetical protein